MSQAVWGTIIPSSTSGTQLAQLLNDFKAAVMSGFIGPSRPTQTVAGGYWIDNSLEGTQNVWDFKLYTGSIDIAVFRLNLTTGKPSITGSDSLFEILQIAANSSGPILKLQKQRIANNGQVLDGDVVGEIQFVGAADDGTKPIVARIKTVSLDDETPIASGGYIIFEATADTTSAMTEMMRLIDSKLGVGTTAPTTTIHAKGTGVTSEHQADDATGAKFITLKKRIAALGKVLSGDVLGVFQSNSTDEAGATITDVAKIQSVAAESHTTTAQGSFWGIYVKKIGQVVSTLQMKIGDVIDLYTKLNATELYYDISDIGVLEVPTTANITGLGTTKELIRMTGSTATNIQGIDAGAGTLAKVISIYNQSSAIVTLKHEDSGATAINRISLPGALNLEVDPGVVVDMFYSVAESRWKLKGGSSGGGGGATAENKTESIAASGAFTKPAKYLSNYLISSTGGAVDASSTPFGGVGPTYDGTEVCIIGTSDTDSVTFVHNDNDYGCILNGNTEIKRGTLLKLKWNATLVRYVEIAKNQIGV